MLTPTDDRFIKWTNKDLYRYLLRQHKNEPYTERMWETRFRIPFMWDQLYTNMYKCSPDNRIKQFEYKPIHNIIATNEHFYKRKKIKIARHAQNAWYWQVWAFYYMQSHLGMLGNNKQCNILRGYQTNSLTLKDIIPGHKLLQKQFHELDVLINIRSFSINKSYMTSKRQTHLNTLKLCLQEMKCSSLQVIKRKYILLK